MKETKLCDICRQEPALLTVWQVSKDGSKVEMNVCHRCAEAKGLAVPQDQVVAFQKALQELKRTVQDENDKLTCPNCRLTYAEFKKTLRLGCVTCYAAFAERLNPTIRRMHGSLKHVGRVPSATDDPIRDYEIQRLRRELRKAIQQEDYERAAAVRDRIRQARGKLGSKREEDVC